MYLCLISDRPRFSRKLAGRELAGCNSYESSRKRAAQYAGLRCEAGDEESYAEGAGGAARLRLHGVKRERGHAEMHRFSASKTASTAFLNQCCKPNSVQEGCLRHFAEQKIMQEASVRHFSEQKMMQEDCLNHFLERDLVEEGCLNHFSEAKIVKVGFLHRLREQKVMQAGFVCRPRGTCKPNRGEACIGTAEDGVNREEAKKRRGRGREQGGGGRINGGF